MGIKERKERDRKLRQKQIIEAAVIQITKNGFKKTTMDEIAEQAELSKGTLYLYFKNKATLYQGIRKEALQQIHQKFQAIFQQDLKGNQLIRLMNNEFIDFVNEKTVYTHSLSLDYSEDEDGSNKLRNECKQLEKEVLMIITRSLQIGIQDKSISTSVQPKVLAIQIGLMMSGLIHFYISEAGNTISEILKQNNINIKYLMQQFMDIYLNQIDMETN
ncbi:MAG: TetR/AcrR family transcriptional regulator [Balneolaceae bacterium]